MTSDEWPYHDEDERPRKSVDVVSSDFEVQAEAVTRPVSGRDDPQVFGEVEIGFTITVECVCGNEVRVLSIQRGSGTCSECGRGWEVQ